MTKSTTEITISLETYDMLEQIKKIFVSYTGEDIDSFSNDKIIEILASGFLWSEDSEGWGCGEGCGCHHNDEEDDHKNVQHHDKKSKGCEGNCKC